MSELTLVCTPGGDADNSYVTVAQADAYFAARIDADAWRADSEKATRLIEATGLIEGCGGTQMLPYSRRQLFWGTPRFLLEQKLHFPTTSDYQRISDDEGGGSTIQWTIPPTVMASVCEQALWLIQQQEHPQLIDHAALQADGVKYIMADSMQITYGGIDRPAWIAPRAWKLISRHRITRFQAA
jgi:hypothetical protein